MHPPIHLVHVFNCSSIYSVLRLLVSWRSDLFMSSFVKLLIYSCMHSINQSFIHSFIHSFIYSFIRSFTYRIHSLFALFNYSLNRVFICSCIRLPMYSVTILFIYASIHDESSCLSMMQRLSTPAEGELANSFKTSISARDLGLVLTLEDE